jgi:hypothetical protein
MAEDNPFLGFFESMGVGMEAGAERRSLMERARQGKLGPGESVPSLGRTILQGITRAATPASTRLAQDQLKLQAANQALDYKIQQDRQKALDAKAYYDKSKEAAEAEAELKDSILYSDSVDKARKALLKGGMEAVWGLPTPQFSDTNISTRYQSVLEYFDKSSYAQQEQDYKSYRAAATEYDLNPNQPFLVLKAQVDGLNGKYTQSPPQIIQMIDYLDKLRNAGDATSLEQAGVLENYIQKLSLPSGQRIEVGKDGRVIFSTGTGALTTSSKTTRQDVIFKARSLVGRLDQLESRITPSTVGAGGVLRDLVNTVGGAIAGVTGREFTGFDPSVAITKTNLDNLKSDLMGYIRSDSGTMSDRDVRMLQQGIPKFSLTESAQQTRTKLNEVKKIILAKEFFARDELDEVAALMSERGVDGFADSMRAARQLGFSPSKIKSTIEDTLDKYTSSQADLSDEDKAQFIKDAIVTIHQSNALTQGEALELFYTFGLIEQPKG